MTGLSPDGKPAPPPGPAKDFSRQRAWFAHLYPGLSFALLTEEQIFAYDQHMADIARANASLTADLLFARFAPLFGLRINA